MIFCSLQSPIAIADWVERAVSTGLTGFVPLQVILRLTAPNYNRAALVQP
jgi:hypothetical protein